MIPNDDLDKLIALHPDRRTLCRMVEMLATAEERERCAKVAESFEPRSVQTGPRHIAAAIRSTP